jgi:hypothetical protein
MANDIPQHQNEEQALRLLAAQRSLYGWAKTAQAVQVFLVVMVPGALLVVEHFVGSFKIWAAFAGLIISVVDVSILETIKASLRRQAASIQELFDCKVLELEWPAQKAKRPDPEDVHGAASSYRGDDLKNWYPQDVGQLPLHIGRIICQRSNCWWDSKLRRHYRMVVLGLSAILFVGEFVLALLKNLSVGDLVVSLAPILPILLWCIREAKQQSGASSRVDRLKSFGDELWDGIIQRRITAEVAATRSRIFQDEIYEHRREGPMVFDWFYLLSREKFESQMTHSAADMIREAREKGL